MIRAGFPDAPLLSVQIQLSSFSKLLQWSILEIERRGDLFIRLKLGIKEIPICLVCSNGFIYSLCSMQV